MSLDAPNLASRDRVIVAIPAYEPSAGLLDVVTGMISAGLTRVLVIDDGSGPASAEVFTQVKQAGATVLHHEVNRGKGMALRTAMTHVLEHAPDVVGVVTADADGQHTITDIEAVAMALLAASDRPRVCVLGERNFDLPDIPLRSRFGNKVTTGILRLLAGRKLRDTQTGLRGLSRDILPELLEVRGDRFDYEMRALMHLLASRADLVSVPIETVYEDGRNATSHFRPVRDSAIIYASILRQAAVFVLTSVLGFLVDIGVFVLLIDALFDGHPTVRAVGICTVVARVVSALVNYVDNHLLVFRTGARVHHSVVRYAVLAVGLVTASWLLTTALAQVLAHHVVWAKLIVDSALFLVSYLVQRHWVFRTPATEIADRPASPAQRWKARRNRTDSRNGTAAGS